MRTALKIAIAGTLVSLLAPIYAHADETPQTSVVGPFGGLNTNLRPEALPATAAQDLLNVDITQGGRSVKKRQGYGLDKSLTYSSSTAHNLYTFFDTSGNQVRLAFNDRNVNASVNGAVWTVILTTGITTGATWDCTDYLGQAYCVSSAFDCPIITNGTSAGTSCNVSIPAGTCVASTGDRLLVGGTSANPSRISYSQSTIFTNFTLGISNSSPSFEDILAPGSKITHLAYRYGRWLWWKDQSFGYLIGTGQTDLQILTVSNTIGTLDNTDVYDNGMTYFRGTDGFLYSYDGYNLNRNFSVDIGPTLATANRRKANSWSQTSQSDFQAGIVSTSAATYTSSNTLSYTISPGDVITSSFAVTETSSSSWILGSSSNMTIWPSSVTISTNNAGSPTNPDFESSFSGNWSCSGGGTLCLTKVASASWPCGTLNPQNGSAFADAEGAPSNAWNGFFVVKSTDFVTSIDSIQLTADLHDCAWHQLVFTPLASNLGKRVAFAIQNHGGVSPGTTRTLLTSDTYILSGPTTFYYSTYSDGTHMFLAFDNITGGSSTITTGYFTSKAYNTGFSSAVYSLSGFNYIALTPIPTFNLQTSGGVNGPFRSILTSSGTNAIGDRYVQYSTTITIAAGDAAQTYISSATIIAQSTGTYYSAVNNQPNLTSWNEFTATDNLPGASAITYYVRASTGSFAVSASTPAWALQTKNATVNYSSGTFVQMRADFTVTAATETPKLSDFQFNWFEGNAADKMYGTYFSNGLWFSVSLGTSTSNNNRIIRYDLLSNAWTLYDIPANGFLTYNNFLYFAGASTGCVFQFGNNVQSDNGTAINSYWKSKEFFGASPFQDEDLRTISWYVKSTSGTTLSMTYQVNESTTTTYSINLFDKNASIIRNNRNFSAGSMYNVINWKFGDNSSNSPWEVFAGQWTYVPRSWSVYP